MKCRLCGSKLSTIQSKHFDDRLWRQRRCMDPDCSWTCSTQEVWADWYKQASALMAGELAEVESLGGPLPTPPQGELLDLESALDEKLGDAINAVGRALQEGAKPDKTQVDTARWLIEDRRAYRRALGAHEPDDGTTELLRLLPGGDEG